VVTKIGAKRERRLIVAQEAPSLERGATPYGPKSMKFLYLLRHAKSSWKEPGLNDPDRPLNRRGRNAAKIMATYLRRSEIKPDLVICSTAIRAKQTLDPIVKAINPPKIILERKIYGGTQERLWEQLWNVPKSARSVLLIGHDPALHHFALELAKTGKPLPFADEKFPTCAMARYRFRGAWKALKPHGAKLISFVTPKALRGIGANQKLMT
jgi:phosphohistidine phosphatase